MVFQNSVVPDVVSDENFIFEVMFIIFILLLFIYFIAFALSKVKPCFPTVIMFFIISFELTDAFPDFTALALTENSGALLLLIQLYVFPSPAALV